MGNVRLKVDGDGIRQAVNALEQLDVNVNARVNSALKGGAEVLRKGIEEAAPVRSGQLKKSVTILPVKSSGGKRSVEAGIRHADAPHAHLVEKGHGGPHPAPPHPFAEPAAEKLEQQVLDAVVKSLMEGL